MWNHVKYVRKVLNMHAKNGVEPHINLVAAPAGEVHVPIVQKQFNVTDSVCQIKTDIAALSTPP